MLEPTWPPVWVFLVLVAQVVLTVIAVGLRDVILVLWDSITLPPTPHHVQHARLEAITILLEQLTAQYAHQEHIPFHLPPLQGATLVPQELINPTTHQHHV